MTITDWINAELARDGLRLAYDDEPAWLEPSSAGWVYATGADVAVGDYAAAWDARSERMACLNRPTVTAVQLADIWRDDNGPARVRAILSRLSEPERNRLTVDYWQLLRQRGHSASLVEIGMQFCVVERLAA